MKIREFLLLIAAVMIAACSSPERKLLVQADSVMEENPDSAMSILNGLSRNDLKGDDLAYYSLLYTQAQVKTDVPLNSDSLISIAYAKYDGSSRGDKGIRSNFYTGEVFFNQDLPRDAMRYYLTAYEESKRLGNDYWRAKSAERIADLFFFAYNYDEAEKYAREAVLYFDKSNRQINHRYSLGQLAIIYLNNNKPSKAYELLDSLLNICSKEQPTDSAFLNYIKHPMIDAMISMGMIEKLKDQTDLDSNNMTDGEKIDAAILQSQIKNMEGTGEDGVLLLNDIDSLANSEEDKVHILYAKYESAKQCGNNIMALSLVDSLLIYQNSVAEKIIKESVTGAQRDFYSEMTIRNANKSQTFKNLLRLVSISFVIILILLIGLFYLHNKVQKSKLRANIESFLALKASSDKIAEENDMYIKQIKAILSEKDETVDRLEKILDERGDVIGRLELELEEKSQMEISHNKIVRKLLKEKWGTLDMLCDELFDLGQSDVERKLIVSNIEKELKKIISPKGVAETVDAVDTHMDRLITRLRQQCPFLKEGDINYLGLIYAGFSVRAVCMFTGIQYQHFYVKKSRLIKRIQNSDAPDKELFIARLKQQ